jgi:hypothetical protein
MTFRVAPLFLFARWVGNSSLSREISGFVRVWRPHICERMLTRYRMEGLSELRCLSRENRCWSLITGWDAGTAWPATCSLYVR